MHMVKSAICEMLGIEYPVYKQKILKVIIMEMNDLRYT